MKIINKSKVKFSYNESCPTCGSRLVIDFTDVKIGDYDLPFYNCPICDSEHPLSRRHIREYFTTAKEKSTKV